MSALFNLDSPLMRTLSRLADLMILNIIFILCCIPIITIGASLTALNYVTLKMRDGEEGYIARSFFKSFTQNFKQATGLWFIALILAAILGGDIFIMYYAEASYRKIFLVVLFALFLIYCMVMLYIFPLLSRFENTIRQTIKNAFIMTILNLPKTLLMLLISIAVCVVTVFNSTTITWGILVWILVGFSAVAYWDSYFLSAILKKYMPKEEESNPDDWTLEEE